MTRLVETAMSPLQPTLPQITVLGIGMDDHLAVENSARGTGQHALVELAAGAVGLGVIDTGVMIAMLPAIRHVQPVEDAFGVLGIESNTDIDPR